MQNNKKLIIVVLLNILLMFVGHVLLSTLLSVDGTFSIEVNNFSVVKTNYFLSIGFIAILLTVLNILYFQYYNNNNELEQREVIENKKNKVLSLIASGKGLNRVLASLVSNLEDQFYGVCMIHQYDRDEKKLHSSVSISIDDSILSQIDTVEVNNQNGSFGAACLRKAPVFVKDISEGELFSEYAESFLNSGIQSAWSWPIIGEEGDILGCLSFFLKDSILPDNHHMNLLRVGSDIAGLSISKDLYDRRLEMVRAKMIASSKMASLGEMAAGIAHEINNPLAIIVAKGEFLKEFINSDTLDKDMLNNLSDKICETALRIAKIISGLRTFSRDASSDPYKDTLVEKILQDSFSLCKEKLKFHHVEIEFPKVEDGLTVECRSVQIVQVIVNLINNAYDAIAEYEEKWIKINFEDHGENVSVAVIDSGKGIPEEVRDKLMEPFFTTKEVGKGTGLGLSISRGIIEDHNGKFYIDADHENTRFVISLPKHQVQGLALQLKAL
jgi:signal transduction histidine kinase